MSRLLLLLPILLTACTVISGNATTGRYSYASVGGNVSDYAQTPSGITAGGIDNAASFRELNKSARFGIGAAAAMGIAKDLSSAWQSTRNAETAASVTKAAQPPAAPVPVPAAPVPTSTFDPSSGLNIIK